MYIFMEHVSVGKNIYSRSLSVKILFVRRRGEEAVYYSVLRDALHNTGTFLLAIVFMVIICIYIGCFMSGTESNMHGNRNNDYKVDQTAYPKDETEWSFIQCLALWFPACTGALRLLNGLKFLHLFINSLSTGAW